MRSSIELTNRRFLLKLGVVASATDTVIVCFAESPNEFRANYPQLSHDMLSAWRQIYPNEIGI